MNNIKPLTRNNNINKFFLVFLLMLCIGPSSISGNFYFATFVYGIGNTALALSFGILYGKLNVRSFLIVLVVLCLYLFFTLIFSGINFSYGAVFPIIPPLILIVFRFRDLNPSYAVLAVYYIIVTYIFILGYAHILIPETFDIYKSFYTYGFDTILDYVALYKKPVSIFGSHAIAGFYYFLIVIISWSLVLKKVNTEINLLIIIICIISLILLGSGTGYFFFMFLFVVYFIQKFTDKSSVNSLRAIIIILSIGAIVAYITLYGNEFLVTMIDRLIGNEDNGLASRYSEGVLKGTLSYISSHPLTGIGFGNVEGVYYADSDYIITTLRISALGTILYFLAFYAFLIDNLKNNLNNILLLFLVIGFMFFMLGNTISINMRMVPFLILMVLMFKISSSNLLMK